MTKFWWALGAVWIILALFICLRPGDEMRELVNFNDKIMHAMGHLLLALYFCGLVPRARWWMIFAFLLVFGIGIEIAQRLMHWGRDADVLDVAANVTGAALGLSLGYMGLSRWPQWLASLAGRRTTA